MRGNLRKFCATIFPKLNIDINSPVQPSYGIKKKVCVRHTFFLPKSPGLSESRGFLIHEASALTCLLPLQPGRLQCRYTRAHTEAGSDGRENGQQSLDDKFPALTSRVDFHCFHSCCVFRRFCVFHSCCVFIDSCVSQILVFTDSCVFHRFRFELIIFFETVYF